MLVVVPPGDLVRARVVRPVGARDVPPLETVVGQDRRGAVQQGAARLLQTFADQRQAAALQPPTVPLVCLLTEDPGTMPPGSLY